MTGEWLLVGMLAFAGACALTWAYAAPKWQIAQKGRTDSARKRATAQPAAPAPAESPSALSIRSLQDAADGWLRVVTPQQLLQLLQAERTLGHMLRQSQLAPHVWQRDLLAAVHRYADFVQLLPASESHHHAHAGGLLAHTLEVVLAAMTWRNGTLLPQGAGAEQIDAERDHWTYVVFYAALLHDIGKVLCDLRVQWRRKAGSADTTRWMPVAGSLSDCGARSYHVGFTPKSERDYGAHQRMPLTLLQRIAPDSARGFMAQQPHALLQLTRFLSGEDRDSPLAQLIRKADQASSARALASGSRARFASASSTPLVELLMGAIRDMLRRGSILPLNRDGAAGWIHDGSAWFVAKRLADAVREHLKQHFPDEALPGESKNDRLFDTWQDYGCILRNPATQQSVWYVRVHGKDGAGYSHMLTMLRFPLDKIWDSPDQYPASMSGHIEVLPSRASASNAESAREGQQELQLPEAGSERTTPEAAVTLPPVNSEAVLEPVTTERSGIAPSTNTKPLVKPDERKVPEVRAPAFRSVARKPAAAVGAGAVSKPEPAAAMEQLPTPAATTESRMAFVEDVLTDSLDDEDRRARPLQQEQPQESDRSPGPVPVATTAVVMAPTVLPSLPGGDPAKKTPSPVAVAFMRWLQEGLRARTLTHNQVGAPVHFVPQGMALVSPLIFREYCRQNPSDQAGEVMAPEKLGLDVQREVLKAGWHLAAAAGTNIHQFAVVKRGGIRTGRLSAVVLMNPERWVLPVPPSNPALSPMPDAASTEAVPAAKA